jgi:NhaA family Na+:H+ antiporter
VHASGVHATVAGVVLALAVPLARTDAGAVERSPLLSFEHALQPWVAFLVMPVFALFNAGVPVGGAAGGFADPVSLGAFLGLLLGKPLGITLAVAAGGALGLSRLPEGIGWGAVLGVGLLGGIGFTMALFIAGLALPPGPMLETAKLAILASSGLVAVIALVVGRLKLPLPAMPALDRIAGA